MADSGERAEPADAKPTRRDPHETVPVLVWADVDRGIAEAVRYLNTIPGIRTICSCQGTIGEGGAAPYHAYVDISWSDDAALAKVLESFDLSEAGDHWGHVHPKPDFRPAQPEEAAQRPTDFDEALRSLCVLWNQDASAVLALRYGPSVATAVDRVVAAAQRATPSAPTLENQNG